MIITGIAMALAKRKPPASIVFTPFFITTNLSLPARLDKAI
jgi:hypothetical protein